MKLAIVSDVHVGNHKRFGGAVVGSINSRCRAVLGVLETAVQRAVEEKADAFIIAGDLFDYARPEAPVMREVQLALLELRCPAYVLVGNHDRNSDTPGDHALGPLAEVEGVNIVAKPCVNYGVAMVPFQPGPVLSWLPGVLHDLCTKHVPSVLVLHMGIIDGKTPPWLANSTSAITHADLDNLLRKYGIDLCVAGDWHEHRSWRVDRRYVMQIGALVPTGFDNPGTRGYGSLVWWDDAASAGGKPLVEELAGPRFLKTRTSDELAAALKFARSTSHKVYVSHVAAPEDVPTHVGFIGKEPNVEGEVLPDEQVALAEARTAATAARSAETFAEALDGFVKSMPLPENVSRAAVLERSRGYVK